MTTQTIYEVQQKLKCGQNLFRAPLIEKLMLEVEQLAKEEGKEIAPEPEKELQSLSEYVRPVLTSADQIQARKDAQTLIRKYGMGRLQDILNALVMENVRLVKEVQEHRAARGIEPLPTFEV